MRTRAWRILTALLIALTLSGHAAPNSAQYAHFSDITFAAHNPLGMQQPLRPKQYRNPVLPGFHPDPSIVRVGADYYLVNSSFAFYPGLPIFHSRDLVHWAQIGNAIDRPDMLDFSKLPVKLGIFAPTIRYFDGRFIIINTCVGCGMNYIITARHPAGPWSKPAFLPSIDGIDPDLFRDDDGRYWVVNNGPPIGTPRYEGHRALWIQELDLKAVQMIGARAIIVDGGVHPANKPIWTEGPHIFKKDGYYYLIAAEGGTAEQHSETVYRATKVTGPYTPGPVNPILTQRDLDPARPTPVYATGHADFVETQRGDWWAVFLGTRPYADNLSNLGRETFLLPLTWQDGWPLILPAKTAVPQAVVKPLIPASAGQMAIQSPASLPASWLMLRTAKRRWWSMDKRLRLEAGMDSLSSKGNPSFVARRQTERIETVTATLRYAPSRIGDHAGLAAFADEDHFYSFGLWKTSAGVALRVTLRNGSADPDEGRIVATLPIPAHAASAIRLRIAINDPKYGFDYAFGSGQWHTLLADADSSVLASERTNQFTGLVVGPYAMRGAAP